VTTRCGQRNGPTPRQLSRARGRPTFVGSTASIRCRWTASRSGSRYGRPTPTQRRCSEHADGGREDREERKSLFGGPPYEHYTVFFNVIREPISFGRVGAQRLAVRHHAAGRVRRSARNFGDFMVPLMSHEYFHLFNVKRIRPRNVALRLPRRAVHSIALVVGGRDRLLRRSH